jgi:2-dehydropantoate 2-reductase
MRILVMGAGGIGGTVTGHLVEMGAEVVASTTNERIYGAVREGGFRLAGDGDQRTVEGEITLGVPADRQFDMVLLATQPPQVEEAARMARPQLAEGGRMMCFQNGLCEQRIGRIIGDDNVIGGIVAWGASMPEPGLYDKTSSGGFVLGKIGGPVDDRIREIGSMLEVIGPVAYTDNLLGARWSKLALNCGISSLGTIGGDRLGSLVVIRKVRRLCLEIFTEVVAVAHAEGVKLEKVAGTLDLDWIALGEEEARKKGSPSLAAKHALLLAVGLRYRRLRSSMLSAIERGRQPAIDFLNGEIVTRGAQHGIDTPVNSLITQTVHEIAAGKRKSSRAEIDRIFEETRL